MITCAVEDAEHYRIQLAEIGEELHDPQPSRQGQTTISCSISKCLGTKRQESLHGRLRVLGLLRDKHISLGDAGRPLKLTPALGGFMALCSLPHSNPGNQYQYGIRNFAIL